MLFNLKPVGLLESQSSEWLVNIDTMFPSAALVKIF